MATGVTKTFGDIGNKIKDAAKQIALQEAIKYFSKDETVDKLCYFIIDNDPSQELYKYLEQRKEGDEIAGLVAELLVFKWSDLLTYLTTSEGEQKLLKLLKNLKRWSDEGAGEEEVADSDKIEEPPKTAKMIENMGGWKDGMYRRSEKCPHCDSRNSTVAIHGAIRQWWCQDCGKAFMPEELSSTEIKRCRDCPNYDYEYLPEHGAPSAGCNYPGCEGYFISDGEADRFPLWCPLKNDKKQQKE